MHGSIERFFEISKTIDEPRIGIKKSGALQNMMVKMASYDAKQDKLLMSDLACLCSSCNFGKFDSCENYTHRIVKAEISSTKSKTKKKTFSDDFIAEEEEFNKYEAEWDKKIEQYEEMDFDNEQDFLDSSSRTKHSQKNVDLSPPDADNYRFSPQYDSKYFKDFGSFDAESDADEKNIMNRLDCMAAGDCIEPKTFLTDKECILAILNRTGLVVGWSLDYIANMLLSQKSNIHECSILKTETKSWLACDKNTRWEWQRNLLTNEDAFTNAKRILFPWNKNGRHWTLFHFDSTRKIIESFDSLHEKPKPDDFKDASYFIKVCFIFFSFNLKS